jgi:hypothetical protein
VNLRMKWKLLNYLMTSTQQTVCGKSSTCVWVVMKNNILLLYISSALLSSISLIKMRRHLSSPHACYIPCPSHSSWFDHVIITGWRVQIVTAQVSQATCSFLPVMYTDTSLSTQFSDTPNWVNGLSEKSKAVPLHAMVALGGRGGIPPTHSWPRHWMGVSGQRVGLRAGLDTEVRGKILCLCRGSNFNCPVHSLRHYWAQLI